ncbi:MAG: ABATE domain-containing protein [Anaerolineae bacterium]|nr:MAG: ABATE domain-containing protein [Anaerolineae bacterium]
MDETRTHTSRFDFDREALCLDFANTAEFHAGPDPTERLNDYSDLVDWGEEAGILSPREAQELRHKAEQHPEDAAAALKHALYLREAIYRIFAATGSKRPVDPADLSTLNRVLHEALSRMQIVASSKGFDWSWEKSQDTLDAMLWPIARSAADLLLSDDLDRVRECADDRGCGYLFIDMSRNRSRRWCSMASCGNRAKAKRHYAQTRRKTTGAID